MCHIIRKTPQGRVTVDETKTIVGCTEDGKEFRAESFERRQTILLVGRKSRICRRRLQLLRAHPRECMPTQLRRSQKRPREATERFKKK